MIELDLRQNFPPFLERQGGHSGVAFLGNQFRGIVRRQFVDKEKIRDGRTSRNSLMRSRIRGVT